MGRAAKRTPLRWKGRSAAAHDEKGQFELRAPKNVCYGKRRLQCNKWPDTILRADRPENLGLVTADRGNLCPGVFPRKTRLLAVTSHSEGNNDSLRTYHFGET